VQKRGNLFVTPAAVTAAVHQQICRHLSFLPLPSALRLSSPSAVDRVTT
jgi:hypothetical protein